MTTIKNFFRRHILWVGFLAVILPLLAILGLQYRSLVKLEQASPVADRMAMKDYLYKVVTEAQEFYYALAKSRLSPPWHGIAERRYDEVVAYFGQCQPKGVKRFFLVAFPKDGEAEILFHDPARETLAPLPDSPEARAVAPLIPYWKMMSREGTPVEVRKLNWDDRDPANRVMTYPILDGHSRVIGAAGMILDAGHFKDELLPQVIRKWLPVHFPRGADENVIVTVHDGGKQLLLATQPFRGQGEEAYNWLPLVFNKWRLAMHNRDLTSEQWARRYFAINLSLSALMTLVLLGGIVLALRTASREMRLSQMKADFVSNVSHELRTPLSSIRVFGEFLRLGRVRDEEKVREYGEYIETESRRLTQLINNILDVSKIESGQKTYQFEPADLGEVLAATLKTFEVRLRQSGFSVAFEAASDPLPRGVIDPDAISQALLNLLDNAVKYSGASKEILVRLGVKDGFVTVSVVDHGVGIPRQEQEKIFERFHRISTGLVHDVKGSGLGLSIVKHIVEAHRGKVTVESQPESGSTFTIHLPQEDHASAPPQRSAPASGGDAPLGFEFKAEH